MGASAGGLEAFTQLLRSLPVDTGMAFVLVQHLAPTHQSALAGILSRATSMPVTEVADEPEVQPNRVYVIPPDRDMVIAHGHLQLQPRSAPRHHPIDQFFRSLAKSQGHLAVGVVLSGTATDGTLGLADIKAEGGITFAQDETAQYDGMPQSAIASGAVDFVLSPEGIAEEIGRIATHPFLAPVAAARHIEDRTRADAPGKQDLAPVLHLVRSRTGIDFTQYKASTLLRRVTRRMVLLKKAGVREYTEFLRGHPAEAEALYQDMLINVTSFFRDPEMFEALKTSVIPALLKDRSRQDGIRIWILGCSTGEEAYSLAMVLSEVMESLNGVASVQIFATDLNSVAVERARGGAYPKERLENVSRERLRRFFVEAEGSFRISKPIRDMCIFSRHNVLSDPPFSRMDLVSCRNLLIYLEPPLQQRVIPILHYALKPTGYLVLGASETLGQFRPLFGIEDQKHKIFFKKPGAARMPPVLPRRPPAGEGQEPSPRATATGTAAVFSDADLYREADRLLIGFAPAAVLVDVNFEILQFRGDTESYLVPAEGKSSFALLKMARPGLLVPLRSALQRAAKQNKPVREEGVRVRSKNGYRDVRLAVIPVKGASGGDGGFLVMFEELPVKGRRDGTAKREARGASKSERQSAQEVSRLEHELTSTREYLQSLSEQHDSAIEELQSTNEESQSVNEELQSINEELETSKEEIQSANEELTIVNEELNNRNLELGRLNNDLTNLINSVQVAIIIVGRDLCIRRFSPLSEKLLNIISSDVGRPITDIRMKVDLPELESLLTEVIDKVSFVEREVKARDGRWYSLRIRPYMTLEAKIEGAVLMMTDIDVIRRAREYAESVVATVRDPLLVLDSDLRVRTASRSFYHCFHVTREETVGRLIFELGDGQWNIQELRRLLGNILPGVSTIEDFHVEKEFEHIGHRIMRLNARKLVVPGEEQECILLVIEDVSFLTRLEAAARENLQRFKVLFEQSPLPKWTFDLETLRFIDVNDAAVALYGYAREEFLEMTVLDVCTPESGEALRDALHTTQRLPSDETAQHRKKSGEIVDVEVRLSQIEVNAQRIFLATVIDVTERHRLERELRVRADELEAANRDKADFIAVLSHELRTPLNAISGWAEVLKRPGLSDDDRQKGIEIIARNSRMQAQLISDVLDAERISTGKLSLMLKRVDLRDEVRAAVDSVSPAAQEKRIRVESDAGASPVFILGDSARLQQILGNLLSNAVKFTPDRGEIQVALRQEDSRAEVSVSDSGVGIASQVLPHIFERFRRGEAPASRLKGGLGLGLAVSKQLVELHGGSISVRSSGKGKGATFTVSLPLISGTRASLQAVREQPDTSPASLSGLMVLVVDDEVAARESLRRMLEDQGADVVSVKSADEALEVLQRQRPDVLVSDIGMPGRNGYDLMRTIRALPPERGGTVPAIALTAFGSVQDRERALAEGYKVHLAKPVDSTELFSTIVALVKAPRL
ncbi:MAG TPA: CheR family methyltransferase [Candidatus Polarisedimenticolia bacterium]|nr:CheR family methyltransferase [Candidatus Polarisedimenticolia bacterium]